MLTRKSLIEAMMDEADDQATENVHHFTSKKGYKYFADKGQKEWMDGFCAAVELLKHYLSGKKKMPEMPDWSIDWRFSVGESVVRIRKPKRGWHAKFGIYYYGYEKKADDWFARRWRMAVRKDRWLMPRKWRKA